MTLRSTLSVAAVLLVAGTASADNLKSGPQVGQENPGGFGALFINGGEHAGKKRCPV